jgi:hypothetical protein
MTLQQFSANKNNGKSTTQYSDCLIYCIKGMDDRLFDFYEKHKPLFRVLLNGVKTREEKIHEFLYFTNGYHLTVGFAKLNKYEIHSLSEAFSLVANPVRIEFEVELNETLKANQKLLLSKLTKKQMKKLNSIIG